MSGSNFSLSNAKHALVLGAGTIGQEIVKEIARQNPSCRIFATKRVSSDTPPDLPESARILELDPTSERSWQYLVKTIQQETNQLDLVISTFGVLHNQYVFPEKRLEDITMETLKDVFYVNTFTAAMAGKHLLQFFSKDALSVFGFLSAKVGSITDDSLGGWYSYRASKAALNMIVKNMAIEFKHRKLNVIALAIHPGTTKTKLSAPYLKGVSGKIWEPEETAEHIIKLIDGIKMEQSGHFENYDGNEISY